MGSGNKRNVHRSSFGWISFLFIFMCLTLVGNYYSIRRRELKKEQKIIHRGYASSIFHHLEKIFSLSIFISQKNVGAIIIGIGKKRKTSCGVRRAITKVMMMQSDGGSHTQRKWSHYVDELSWRSHDSLEFFQAGAVGRGRSKRNESLQASYLFLGF